MQLNQEAPDYVLVVDDDAEIRTLLAEYLSQNGIRITMGHLLESKIRRFQILSTLAVWSLNTLSIPCLKQL